MMTHIKIEALKTFAESEGYNQFTDQGMGQGKAFDTYINGLGHEQVFMWSIHDKRLGYAKVLTWLIHSNIVPVGTTWEDVGECFATYFENGFAVASKDFGG